MLARVNKKPAPSISMPGQDTFSCGATLLDAFAPTFFAYHHTLDVDNGDRAPTLHTQTNPFRKALGSPFELIFPAAITPPATLFEGRERAYSSSSSVFFIVAPVFFAVKRFFLIFFKKQFAIDRSAFRFRACAVARIMRVRERERGFPASKKDRKIWVFAWKVKKSDQKKRRIASPFSIKIDFPRLTPRCFRV